MVVSRLSKSFINKRSASIALVSIIGLAAIVWGCLYYVNRYLVGTDTANTPAGVIADAGPGLPSEKKPDMRAEYVVADNQPRRIIAESIGVDGFIQKVGMSEDREVGVPNNIHSAGWFIDTVIPGDEGLSIIDGHVGGVYTKNAIFKRLEQMAPGDTFLIEFGDLSVKRFEVVKKYIVPEEKSAQALFTKDINILSQLNLVTCGGKFDSAEKTYDQRTIVTSKAL